MINQWIGVGRITADTEVRKTTSGMSIVRFTVAIDRPKKDGEDKGADFINCIAFNKTADFMGSYVRKGNRLGIKGRIQTGSYEKDGRKIYTTDIIVDSVDLLESRQNTQAPSNAKTNAVSSQPLPKAEEKSEFGGDLEINPDDLPFGG